MIPKGFRAEAAIFELSNTRPLNMASRRSGACYSDAMTTTLFMNGGSQAVLLPSEMRLPGDTVSIRKVGDGILIEPIKAPRKWPDGFAESIRIDDPAFERPPQGELPPVQSLD